MSCGNSQRIELKGIPVFPGVVCSEYFLIEENVAAPLPVRSIGREQVESEQSRFLQALALAKDEVALLQEGGGEAQREILGAQVLMLSDPEFVPHVKAAIESRLVNAESALKSCIDAAVAALRASGNDFLAARAADIEDAFGRVLQKLTLEGAALCLQSGAALLQEGLSGKILAAQNLAPSQAVSLKRSGIAAIIMEEGGPACHVAVLAKSWRIPTVLGVAGLVAALKAQGRGAQLLVDGAAGAVIVNPSIEEKEKCAQSLPASKEKEAAKAPARLKCETADGVPFSLFANIATPDECADAFLIEGISGVGLFRTEFLFLQEGELFLADEAPQFEAYKAAAIACGGRPLTIRTMDLGGDKSLLSQAELREKNPLLGWRALRYCLSEREVFKTQLKAILRASIFGNVRVMFPMVATTSELEAALLILEEAKAACRAEGAAFDEGIKAGAMIEVPAAAVCADLIARRVDFMSIGTNDLIQYTMAADRENPKVAYLHSSFEPAVLRLIERVLQCGKAASCEVSLCGEMAADPIAACLLFGLGLRKFSVSPSSAEAVAEALSGFSASFLEASAQKALECDTGEAALAAFKSALRL